MTPSSAAHYFRYWCFCSFSKLGETWSESTEELKTNISGSKPSCQGPVFFTVMSQWYLYYHQLDHIIHLFAISVWLCSKRKYPWQNWRIRVENRWWTDRWKQKRKTELHSNSALQLLKHSIGAWLRSQTSATERNHHQEYDNENKVVILWN